MLTINIINLFKKHIIFCNTPICKSYYTFKNIKQDILISAKIHPFFYYYYYRLKQHLFICLFSTIQSSVIEHPLHQHILYLINLFHFQGKALRNVLAEN